MNQHPILFNGDMVRAILDGTKTQTRRVCKPQPHQSYFGNSLLTKQGHLEMEIGCKDIDKSCPYGLVGDQLWVRETFFSFGRWVTRFSERKCRDEWHFIDMTTETDRIYQYDTTLIEGCIGANRSGVIPRWWKRPSIFMSRWASRITLEITNIRVEQLHNISEEDALSEGAIPLDCDHARHSCEEIGCYGDTAKAAFRGIWESTGGVWNANPWVWVIEFKRVQP